VVVDFSPAIVLRIIEKGESMCDFVLSVETGHLLTGKVHTIVRDNDVEESEVAYYILPEELDNLFPMTSESDTTLTYLVE